MYDSVLLPTDGSQASERALEYAIDLAQQYDAALHVMYVIDKAVFAGDVETGTIVTQFEQVGQSVLEEVETEATRAGIETTITHLGRGSPHEAILEYTEEEDIDVVVMGTRGRTGLDRYLLGSVTEKVVRLSDVPVLTVRHSERADSESTQEE
ncbi:universal stress protein [Halobacteria archaeon AArc-curdl1]|uniref:Universal stress protein n=1 Tax=Natronosalvus hydrolyticus TaxID=2979988 RepID=A0AAP2ZA55_9EURY|nr:universal stress protein [Halobacteria archaeon AArc-curdl1]